MTDVEGLAAQVGADWTRMLAALAPDEFDPDEPLEFKTDSEGRLMVRSAFAVYKLDDDGRVWRWRPESIDEPEGAGWAELFADGRLVHSAKVGAGTGRGGASAWN